LNPPLCISWLGFSRAATTFIAPLYEPDYYPGNKYMNTGAAAEVRRCFPASWKDR